MKRGQEDIEPEGGRMEKERAEASWINTVKEGRWRKWRGSRVGSFGGDDGGRKLTEPEKKEVDESTLSYKYTLYTHNLFYYYSVFLHHHHHHPLFLLIIVVIIIIMILMCFSHQLSSSPHHHHHQKQWRVYIKKHFTLFLVYISRC